MSSQARHIDGSPMFASPEDTASENAVSKQCEAAWRCSLRRFGALAPIDWYAVREDRLIGVAELKVRTHASTKYPTVWLSARKWMALMLAEQGLGVPGMFVASFTDGVRYIDVRHVDARRCSLARLFRNAGRDGEPVIEVPVLDMVALDVKR